MKNKNYFLLSILALGSIVFCCKKKFDNPPYKVVDEGARLTINQLKGRTSGANSIYRFGEGDTNLFCTVSADESSGNLYKQIYALDDEGSAIQLRLLNSGGLYAGDRIRINLNHLNLVSGNSMIYLDSIDTDNSVIKLSSGNAVPLKTTTIAKILTYSASPKDAQSLQSQVVELGNVEFQFSARAKPFANAIGKTAYEYALTDCAGNEIMVRTSGMANFAGKLTPTGNGKLQAVVQQYNTELSLVIINYNELLMNSKACVAVPPTTITGVTYINKDFNDNNLLSGNWLLASNSGSTTWTSSNFGSSSYYARIYNKTGTVYETCESWLITPEIDLSSSSDPVLTFQTANSSAASPLNLMVSTNYTGGKPSTATWTEIPFVYPKGNFEFASSGIIAMSAYKNQKIHLGFKYSGTSISGSIWEVDNVVIYEKQ